VCLAALLAATLLASAGCSAAKVEAAPPVETRAAESPEQAVIRATGVVQAVRSLSIRVPQLNQTSGSGNRSTITRLARNGVTVQQGEVLVEFDRTALLDQEIEAKARLSELTHQLDEKQAQNRSDSAKRQSQLREAEADLRKAALQLRKGPILSEIDRKKNEAKAESAQARVESLKRSDAARVQSEIAAVEILKLKLQRQQVMLERIQTNLEKLVVRSPQDGMVAHENIWRSGSMGPPQEGDQVWPGSPLVRIFDPTLMVVETTISEADFRYMGGAARGKVYLDAYPDTTFDAELETASLVATSGVDSPVRSFYARFRVVQQDQRLLPDLSASIEIRRAPAASASRAPQQAALPPRQESRP
jgi:multidrug resistance efflux pump